MEARPVVTGREDAGCAIWHGDALWQFRVTSDDSADRLWIAELLAPAGWASPVHMHTKEDETFIVLEGELRVQIAGEVHKVLPGGSVFMPRDIPHAYRAEAHETRFLVVANPGGFDRWFIETGQKAESLTLPPPATEPPDYAAYVAGLAAHGVQFIAPPPDM